MPNWCENDLVVKGKSKALDEFAKFVEGPNGAFDFEKIIPMPEVFKGVTTGFNTIDGKLYENWREDGTGVEEEELARWREEYGHDNWRNWSLANWGTKWNASEAGIEVFLLAFERVKYTFSTAWSPPLPIIEALAERFPKLKFSLKYYECGCAFKGYIKYKKGEVVEEGSGSYSGPRGG